MRPLEFGFKRAAMPPIGVAEMIVVVGSSGLRSMARSRFFTASSKLADPVIGPAQRVHDVAVGRGAVRRRA